MNLRRHTIVAISAAVILVMAVAGVVVWRTAGDDADAAVDDRSSGGGPPQPHQGRFVVECRFHRSAPNDPIVHYGMTGMSHLHDFFGSDVIDASSTTEDLVAGGTTCRTQQDRASYWAPALYDGDRQIVPAGSNAYYRAGAGVDPTEVQQYPLGLKMVSGDQFSTTDQPTEIVGFSCGFNPRRHAAPPDCGEGSPLRVRVTFPDCWDGEHLDSDDHKSHMAHSGPQGCPDDHPVPVPELEFVIEYPFHGDASRLRLASGETFTAHADFFNAWEEEKLAGEIRLCIQADVVCGGAQLGPHGT